MTEELKELTEEQEKELIATAIKNFQSAQQAVQSQRDAAREDLAFVAGIQSNGMASSEDDYDITVPLLGPFLSQITAEARTKNPAIKVVPVSTDANADTAAIYSGLIRHIEQKSRASEAYQQALWYAAASGEGYMFLSTDYMTGSWDQEICIEACDNPEKVFLDPNHVQKDGQDAEWGFVISDIAKDTYKRKYSDTKLSELIDTNSWTLLSLPNDWVNTDTIRIAKYWVKDYKLRKIWSVQDPITLEHKDVYVKPGDDVILLRKNPREEYEVTVHAYVINAYEVIQHTIWAGPSLPIFKVVGETFSVGGQRVQYGAVRQSKGTQRRYNFAVSRQTEMIDMAPKSGWVITEKQMGNNADIWTDSNRRNFGALPWTFEAGNTTPPFRGGGLDMSAFQGVTTTLSQALDDLKFQFGLGVNNFGDQSGPISGVAQDGRTDQASRTTYRYFDNFLYTLAGMGRHITKLVPKIYDTDRVIRIVKPDSEEQMVAVNSISNNNRYDLSAGDYDVVVETGPAYSSKREATHAALGEIQTVLPDAPIGDLWAGTIDDPIGRIVAKRIKATYPPEVIAASEDANDDMAPKELLTKAQQQLAQTTQQLQQLDAKAKELEDENKQLKDKTALELTKADMDDKQKEKQLDFDRQTAMAEYGLKEEDLELRRRAMTLAEKEFQLKATVAAHNANEDSKPEKPVTGVEIPRDNSTNSNLGGDVAF